MIKHSVRYCLHSKAVCRFGDIPFFYPHLKVEYFIPSYVYALVDASCPAICNHLQPFATFAIMCNHLQSFAINHTIWSLVCQKSNCSCHENPLENKLRFQLVLRRIKRLTDNSRRLRCPITQNLLLQFRCRLDLTLYDHCQERIKLYSLLPLYVLGCLLCGIFEFLRSGEFTLAPNLPVGDCLQISDLSVDSVPFPTLIMLKIKVSKADPLESLVL